MDKTITINWGKLLSQQDAAGEPGGGIYQFYGWHPAFSKDDNHRVLLYIGDTDGFGKLSDHGSLRTSGKNKVPPFFRPESVEIRLASVGKKEQGITRKKIAAMLISVHTPPWNHRHINTIAKSDVAVTIHNIGSPGDLLQEFRVKPGGTIDLIRGRRE